MTLDDSPVFSKIKYLKSKGELRLQFEEGDGEWNGSIAFPPREVFEALQELKSHFCYVMQVEKQWVANATVLGIAVREQGDETQLKVWMHKPVRGDRTALISSPYAPLGEDAREAFGRLTTEAEKAIEGHRAQQDMFKADIEGDLAEDTAEVAIEAKRDVSTN